MHQLPIQSSNEEDLKTQKQIDYIRQIIAEERRQKRENVLGNTNYSFDSVSSINNTIINNNNNYTNINEATQHYVNDIFLKKKVNNYESKREKYNDIISKLNSISPLNTTTINTSNSITSGGINNNLFNNQSSYYLVQSITNNDIIDNAKKFTILNTADSVKDEKKAKEIMKDKNFQEALLNNSKKRNGKVIFKNDLLIVEFDPEGDTLSKLKLLNRRYKNKYNSIIENLADNKIEITLDHQISYEERLNIATNFKTNFVNSIINLYNSENVTNITMKNKKNEHNTVTLLQKNVNYQKEQFISDFQEATLIANEWKELDENIKIYNNRIANKFGNSEAEGYNPIVNSILNCIIIDGNDSLNNNINDNNSGQNINNSIFSEVFPNGINTSEDFIYAKELIKSFCKEVYNENPEIMEIINNNKNISFEPLNEETIKQSILIPCINVIHINKLKYANIAINEAGNNRDNMEHDNIYSV